MRPRVLLVALVILLPSLTGCVLTGADGAEPANAGGGGEGLSEHNGEDQGRSTDAAVDPGSPADADTDARTHEDAGDAADEEEEAPPTLHHSDFKDDSIEPEQVAACSEAAAPGQGPAKNAPLLQAWQGTPDELAQRLAEALDDPIVGDPSETHLQRVWNTTSGTLSYRLVTHEGPLGGMTWHSSRDLSAWSQEEGVEWLRGVVGRFAGDDAGTIDVFADTPPPQGWTVRFGQHVEGRLISTTVGYMSTAGGYLNNNNGTFLSWGAAYALPERVEVDEAAAHATARSYMRCVLDAMDRTEEAGYPLQSSNLHPTLSVVDDSLAHRFGLSYAEPYPRSHCGEAWWVLVDAATGAPLAHRRPLCY